MKYFHRTHLPPDEVLAGASQFFGATLAPMEEEPRRRQYAGSIGRISVSVQAEGGHYTLVTVETNQVGESEADKLAKRFLTLVHTKADPGHRPIGAY
ncbi:MAG TPA: hypothetical protein VE282_00190 [Gemmatimonadales bacterium]|nr:hypothetical protein [Gemmatimonadales bacterium]